MIESSDRRSSTAGGHAPARGDAAGALHARRLARAARRRALAELPGRRLRHVALGARASTLDGRPVQGWNGTVELVARYLQSTWPLKSFSCWEEFDGGEHASTLGALVAGLDAAARLLRRSRTGRTRPTCVRAHLLEPLRRTTAASCAARPTSGSTAACCGLACPFAGAAARRPADSRGHGRGQCGESCSGQAAASIATAATRYYGGGEWILLTCSLALARGPAPAICDAARAAPRVGARAGASRTATYPSR